MYYNFTLKLTFLVILFLAVSCKNSTDQGGKKVIPVGDVISSAKAEDGSYISWKEHIVDDTALSGGKISGSDGLVMADLDADGFLDIISVHEADTEYDGIANGLIRIAYGSADPDVWELVTLAEGEEAGAVEDVFAEDINGDGYLDLLAACELSHIIYFENPKVNVRSTYWKRLIPEITKNRGSFIRVTAADLNNEGSMEVIAANKGSKKAKSKELQPKPISYFEILGDPLQDASWKEHELINVLIPINAEPVDLDKDGDMDIIAGSRGERRLVFMENISDDSIRFLTHNIDITDSEKYQLSGSDVDFMDVNNDSRLDIVVFDSGGNLIWLEQPANWNETWTSHFIGSTNPDQLSGLLAADINGDGLKDFITGGYSRGPRDVDGDVTAEDQLGRLAWFENPKDLSKPWKRHDISRRKRGMFDKFEARDMDGDGDIDFISTRGNSYPYDGVFWLEQVRTEEAGESFTKARQSESEEMPLPNK